MVRCALGREVSDARRTAIRRVKTFAPRVPLAPSHAKLRRRPSSCDVAPRAATSPLELRRRPSNCELAAVPVDSVRRASFPSARCRKVRPRQRVLAVPHWLPRPMRGAARIGALELGPAIHPGTEGCMASARVLIPCPCPFPCPRCRELGRPTGRDEQRTLAGQATAVVQMGCELVDASREAGRVRAAAQPTRKASSPSRSSCVSGA